MMMFEHPLFFLLLTFPEQAKQGGVERADDGDVNQEIDRMEPEGVEPGEAEEDVCAVVDCEGKHGEGAVAAVGVLVRHRCPPEIVFEHTID